jgi:hypothetical protein
LLALEKAEELADFVQENAVSVEDVLRVLHGA